MVFAEGRTLEQNLFPPGRDPPWDAAVGQSRLVLAVVEQQAGHNPD